MEKMVGIWYRLAEERPKEGGRAMIDSAALSGPILKSI